MIEPNQSLPPWTLVLPSLLLSSSFFNPLLYFWRIKEIRDSARNIVRKLCCKENVEET